MRKGEFIMADKKKNSKGTAFANPVIGEVVPAGYIKKKNKDGTISYVPPKGGKKK